MRDVPQNDQRRAAPELLHAEIGIGIAGLAAEHAGVPLRGTRQIVDEEDDVVDADQREGRSGCVGHVWLRPAV
jgi:hypothetical protein